MKDCFAEKTASNRDEFKDWLKSDAALDVAVTLMPKKDAHQRHPNKNQVVSAATKFIEILNGLTYKQAYRRYGKRLFVVMVIEGEASLKDLHCHFAIGLPEGRTYLEFSKLIKKALVISGDFLIESEAYRDSTDSRDVAQKYKFKLDVADAGWVSYITKELDQKRVENLFLI